MPVTRLAWGCRFPDELEIISPTNESTISRQRSFQSEIELVLFYNHFLNYKRIVRLKVRLAALATGSESGFDSFE